MSRFVILAPFRSGSTALKLALGKHCLNEVFSQSDYHQLCPELAAQRHQRAWEYLNCVLDSCSVTPVGAKIMMGEFGPAGMETLLASDFKKIFVVRENLTDAVLSWEYTMRGGPSQLVRPGRLDEVKRDLPPSLRNIGVALDYYAPPEHATPLSIADLEEKCQQTVRAVPRFVRRAKNWILVTYNELFHPDGGMSLDVLNRVREYVGLARLAKYWTPTRKLANEELWRASFSNYDECVAALAPQYGQPFSRDIPPAWDGFLPVNQGNITPWPTS